VRYANPLQSLQKEAVGLAEVKPAFFKFSTKEAQIAAAREMNMLAMCSCQLH